MDSFNGQILVEKLTKLNNSQQSIETLSHWCIFHRNKAKYVVETWERQFHRSPQEQRVSFLYLANDILQNSRRKGIEYVSEFWRALPDVLNDVLENGDEFGRKAVLRIVDILDERKVFGSRGHVLKEEISRRNTCNKNQNGRSINYKLKQGIGEELEKLISGYEHIYKGSVEEDIAFGKSQAAINCVDEVRKKAGNDMEFGNFSDSGVMEELREQHGILGECLEQLKAAESARGTLLSNLREALLEQEMKIERVHSQVEATLTLYDQLSNIFEQSIISKPPTDQEQKDRLIQCVPLINTTPVIEACSRNREDLAILAPPRNCEQAPSHESHQQNEVHWETAAAAMAAKLAASSSSSTEKLSYVLSSFPSSEITVDQVAKEDYPSDSKRPKFDGGVPTYIPPETQPLLPPPPPPPPPFPHPDSLRPPPPPPPEPSPPLSPPGPNAPAPALLQPPLPTYAPPLTQFLPNMPYNYCSLPLQMPPTAPSYSIGLPPYPPPPLNPYNFHPAPPSVSRQ